MSVHRLPPELREVRSAQSEPADFDEFWRTTIDAARAFDIDVALEPVPTGLRTIDVYEVGYRGFGGHRIHGWLRVPAGTLERDERLPAVVHFTGYGAGRGNPLDDLAIASAGFVHLTMDTRGQGSGVTADPVGSGPSGGGFITRGLADKERYTYRRVYSDAVRAVDAVRALQIVDAARVAVIGNSQGGGIALAVGGLVPGLAAVLAQAPFLCDFPEAIAHTRSGPITELLQLFAMRRYDAAAFQETLAYFDGVTFAKRATAPGHLSVGLLDDISTPRTVLAAFDAYAAEKHLAVWPHNGHEAGGSDDLALALDILHRVLRSPEERCAESRVRSTSPSS